MADNKEPPAPTQDDLSHKVENWAKGVKEARKLRREKWKIAAVSGVLAGLLAMGGTLTAVSVGPLFREERQTEDLHNKQSGDIIKALSKASRENRRHLIEIECLLGVAPERRSGEEVRKCRAEAERRVPEPTEEDDTSPR